MFVVRTLSTAYRPLKERGCVQGYECKFERAWAVVVNVGAVVMGPHMPVHMFWG